MSTTQREYISRTALRGYSNAFRSEPSAGTAVGFLATTALPLLRSNNEYNDLLLRSLASALIDIRPFPGMRWAEKILNHLLTRRQQIQYELEECLKVKATLGERLNQLAASLQEELQLAGSTPIVALGSSEAVYQLMGGLAQPRQPVVVPASVRNGNSEGAVTVSRLRSQNIDAGLHRGYTVRDYMSGTVGSRGRNLPTSSPGLLVFGCSLVSGADSRHLECLVPAGTTEYVNLARSKGIPTVLAFGTYKIWPIGYYLENRTRILDRSFERDTVRYQTEEYPEHSMTYSCAVEEILDISSVSFIVTERGVCPSTDFARQYESLLANQGDDTYTQKRMKENVSLNPIPDELSQDEGLHIFESLANDWLAAVRFESSLDNVVADKHYQAFIAIGMPAVPYILSRRVLYGEPWESALESILGVRIPEAVLASSVDALTGWVQQMTAPRRA